MKRVAFLLAVCAGLALLASFGGAADKVRSGPQVDEELPGPFHPLNLTGKFAGQKSCLYCANGVNPVAAIFARKLDKSVAKLIKQIDAATAANAKHDMGSYVVFLSNDDKLPARAKELAKKHNIQHTVLSVEGPAGPEGYKIARKADVTVVLYEDVTVRANHTFLPGQLDDMAIKKIVADVSKIIEK